MAKIGAGNDLTQTQSVMGTPAYMAPEQAAGRTKFAGPATDGWALGVILYECLTGLRPFRGEDVSTVLYAVVNHDPVPPRGVNPTVPRALDLIVRKCLEKDPRERYPTASELAEDLERFAGGRPIRAGAASWWVRFRRWAGQRRRETR